MGITGLNFPSNMADDIYICKGIKKPEAFQLKKGEEFYMIGSEVGHYLNLMKGALYKKFPSLWRRYPTIQERKQLLTLDIGYNSMSNSNIMFVKASEIDEILKGIGERYKDRPPESPGYLSSPRMKRPISACRSMIAPLPALPREAIDASVQHLNAVSYQAKTRHQDIWQREEQRKRREERRSKILPLRQVYLSVPHSLMALLVSLVSSLSSVTDELLKINKFTGNRKQHSKTLDVVYKHTLAVFSSLN